MPPSKRNKKADKKELDKWIKDNDLTFVKSKMLSTLGTERLADVVILTEEDVRSANVFNPVQLRKFMNAISISKTEPPLRSASTAVPPANKPTAGGSSEGKAKAKFAWQATGDEQLTVSEGETLTILDSSRKWWKMRNSVGDEGTVPSNYLEKLNGDEAPPPSPRPKEPTTDSPVRGGSKKSISSLSPSAKPDLPDEIEDDIYAPVDLGGDEHDYEDPDDVAADKSKKEKGRWQRTDTVKQVPDTEPLGSDPLEWMNGEVIRWLVENDLADFKDVFYANGFDGATLVTLNSQSFKLGGFDPVRCDKLQEALDGLSDPIIGRAKALYGYQATKPTQLSFKEGDILEVIDNKASWWKAKKGDGQKGMVPSNYLEMVAKETKTSASGSSADAGDIIEDQPWFCNMDRKAAEGLLKRGSSQIGDFLVRPSRTAPGDHTLTALGKSGIMNLKIQQQKPGVYVLGQFSSQFGSISKLVEYHKVQEIRITGKEPVLLIKPISK